MLYAEGKHDEALKAMSAAADAEDKTEKHPVTPGPPTPARELYGADAARARHGERGARRLRGDVKKEPNRFGAYAGAARRRKAGDTAKAKQHYMEAVALTENADPVRPQIAEARAFLAKK